MKFSSNFKATLSVILFMLYLAFAILGFEEAKAEVPVADKMLGVSTCIAAHTYVSEVMTQRGRPALALVFSQEADKFITLWERDFPDVPWGPVANKQWIAIDALLRSGKRSYNDVMQMAKFCTAGWD